MSILATNHHPRDIAGLKYIYPVLSRRAGGLSIGVNFNTNNACNWRCIYCQVPDLQRGTAPAMDFQLLEDELRFFLTSVLYGDFYQRFQVPANQRVIKDIAISGNGEPTSLKEFARTVDLLGRIATESGVLPVSRYVLISNGSLVHLPRVQQGLKTLQNYGGELWFKLDSATEQGLKAINNAAHSCQSHINNLLLAAQCCQTKLQICLLDDNGKGLTAEERAGFLTLFSHIKDNSNVQTVMLYTIARASFQPEASRLKPLSASVLHGFANEISRLGFEVSVSI